VHKIALHGGMGGGRGTHNAQGVKTGWVLVIFRRVWYVRGYMCEEMCRERYAGSLRFNFACSKRTDIRLQVRNLKLRTGVLGVNVRALTIRSSGLSSSRNTFFNVGSNTAVEARKQRGKGCVGKGVGGGGGQSSVACRQQRRGR
jgi:hypothetical protein